ncbi:murein hydrolase activator EnvC [uncultured Clostridium sp.]|jgi:murein DD-endopeptidase MepM/ murein hydrolase activator NlpD|uniref:murein hydrolase activator EnvC family protein n=1 Tax=uncultured Clostridium sp. TaxID=59620 RepID=UPI002636B310|nr:M23 family metallopeptidase [uncultured Clostridium sp.]
MKKKQILALTLGVLMSSAMLVDPTIAEAKSKDEIKNQIEANEGKIDDLEEKKEGLQGTKSESAKKLEEAKANFNKQNELLTETREKVLGFEKEINTLQVQIDDFEAKIQVVVTDIEKVKIDIAKKEAELLVKEEILGKRLRSAYMNNVGDRMLYMVIDSKNLGDLISNIANINIIIKTDQELMAEIEKDKEAIELERQNLVKKEQELTKSKETIEGTKAKVVSSKEEMDKLEAEYAAEAAKLKDLEDARSSEYNALTSEEKAIQAEISKYEHDNVNLEEYFQNTSIGTTPQPPASGGTSGSGDSSDGGSANSQGFIKPLSAPVTSSYGPRTHPITGAVGTFHRGIDYGAAGGTPIKAIAGGVVTTAGWNSSFGNMVVVDHGNGYTSLYAHARALNVSAGQRVSQGQVLSFVGSTGNSTGNHLHLEMRYNGSHVNPANYIG